MNILYVSHTHPPKGAILDNVGGMQRVSIQLIEALERKKDVSVFKEVINVSGIFIGLMATNFLLKNLLVLPKKVKETNADVIVFSSMVTASLAFFIRSRVSVPMITINHGRDVTLANSLYQKFVPKIFDSLDGVISVSSATRDECIKRGMNPNKGVALPNGFDLNKLEEFPDKNASRKFLETQFGLPLSGKKMLLTVGRKVKRKGHEWFIRNVLPQISSEVIYVTVGDGPEMENVERSINDLGLRNEVFLLGRQPDAILNKAYAAADIFVMPNIPVKGDMEGFGIVLLEANMAATPAVAADLEGIKDVITNGENGFKIPVRDAQLFAHKIDELVENDLDDLSQKTSAFVVKKFSWQTVSDQYLKYFKSIYQHYNQLNSSN